MHDLIKSNMEISLELRKVYKKSFFVGVLWSLAMIATLAFSIFTSSQIFYSVMELIMWLTLCIITTLFHELGHASASQDCNIKYNVICFGRRQKEQKKNTKKLWKWLLSDTKIEFWRPFFPFNVDYDDHIFEQVVIKDFLLVLRSGALVGIVLNISALLIIILSLIIFWLIEPSNYYWMLFLNNVKSSIYFAIICIIFQLLNFIPIYKKDRPLSDGAIIKSIKKQKKANKLDISRQYVDIELLKDRI